MTDGLAYVIICSCTGSIEPLAFLDDARPSTVGVVVRPVSGHDRVTWIPPRRRGELTRADYADLSGSAVGFAGDLHTVRCAACRDQAQMSTSSLAGIADTLAAQANAGRLACIEVPAADSRPQLVGALIYTPPAGPTNRYVVPLAVLCGLLGSRKW